MTQRTWKCCSSNSCTKLYRLIYLNFSWVPQVIGRHIQGIQKNRWSIFTEGTRTGWLGQQKVWYRIQVACGKMTVEQVGRKWQCAIEPKAQSPAAVWGWLLFWGCGCSDVQPPCWTPPHLLRGNSRHQLHRQNQTFTWEFQNSLCKKHCPLNDIFPEFLFIAFKCIIDLLKSSGPHLQTTSHQRKAAGVEQQVEHLQMHFL